MNVGFDIDGTLDAFPEVLGSVMAALAAAGHHVYVLTGVEADQVTEDDVAAKQQYLMSIGCTSWFALYVLPEPHDTNKAQVIKEQDIKLLVDNSVANAKAAVDECAVLVLWNAKVKN